MQANARVLKPVVFITLGLPLLWLAYAIVQELSEPGAVLGADPGEAVVLFLGEWNIRILLLTLCVSTARRLLRHRREKRVACGSRDRLLECAAL